MKFALDLITRNGYTLAVFAVLAFSAGCWATVKFYKASEVSALEKTIEEYKTKDAQNREKYRKFAEEKQKISEKVIYVEKPHYVDCRPDGDWLREFNAKIAK